MSATARTNADVIMVATTAQPIQGNCGQNMTKKILEELSTELHAHLTNIFNNFFEEFLFDIM
jgi:hypothetical protein